MSKENNAKNLHKESKTAHAVLIRKRAMRMYVELCKERKNLEKVLYKCNRDVYSEIDRHAAKNQLRLVNHSIAMYRHTLGI